MELCDFPTNQQSSQPADLQLASVYYRHFYCHACGSQKSVCTKCDRGQIYCAECKPLRKRERIQKARDKYKKSRHGRIKRSASSQERRAKIKRNSEHQNPPEMPHLKINEGDRGPLLPKVSNTTPEPAIPAEQKTTGVSADVQFSNPIYNSAEGHSERSPRKPAQIICTFCKRECSPFQRQKKGRLAAKEKKSFRRWRASFRDKDP